MTLTERLQDAQEALAAAYVALRDALSDMVEGAPAAVVGITREVAEAAEDAEALRARVRSIARRARA